mgnify:CR=1 FL=1
MADQNEEFEAFTIPNELGELWTRTPFRTENEALNYIEKADREWAKGGLENHKVVPCTVTIKPHAQ